MLAPLAAFSLVLLAHAASAAAAPASTPPIAAAAAPERDLELELVCGGATPLVPQATPGARFTVDRDGGVRVEKGERLSFAWEGDGTPIVRVDVHRGGKLAPVACFRAEGREAYAVPREKVGQADYAVIQVFDLPTPGEKARANEILRARQAAIATPDLAWQIVLRVAGLPEVRAMVAPPGQAPNVDAVPGAAVEARRGIATLTAEHGSGATPWSKAVKAQVPRAVELVSELERSHDTVVADQRKAREARELLERAASDVAEKAKARADAEAALRAARPIDRAARQKALDAAKLALAGAEEKERSAAGAVVSAERAVAVAMDGFRATAEKLPDLESTEAARKSWCNGMAMLAWLEKEGHVRLVVRAEVPLDVANQFVTAVFGAGSSATGWVAAGERLGLLLADVPSDEKISFKLHKGQKLPSAADAFANFLVIAVNAGLRAASFPAACTDLKMDARVDAAAPPIAGFGTRAIVVPTVPSGYRTSVFVCSGPECTPGKADAPVRNEVQLDLLPTWRVTLLGELNGTVPVVGTDGAFRTSSFGTPTFEPIGGTSGPDQLYQLRRSYDGRQSFGTSVLLALQQHKWLGAIGPTVWTGGESSPFTQWNLRAGRVLGEGFVLTFGATTRLVKDAIDYREGDVVSVSRASGGQAPSPRVRNALAFGASIGIAIDLAVLTDAGEALLKATGVKK